MASYLILFSSLVLSAYVYGYTIPEPFLEYYNELDTNNLGNKMALTPTKEQLTECIEMRGEPGVYQVTSVGQQMACGIFIVGPVDAQVEINFLTFDVDCKDGGIVGILDGWEQNGAVFPDAEDMGEDGVRHLTYCGHNRPKHVFRSTGNMALVQYRLPDMATGFIIRVTFPSNPRPCNVVSALPEGKFTLRNYGLKVNCSVMAMYPERMTFTYINVGVNEAVKGGSHAISALKPSGKCDAGSKQDTVEVRGGGTIELKRTNVFKQYCGFHPFTRESHNILCGATIVRLVSSGRYDNVVNVELVEPLEDITSETDLEKTSTC